MLDINTDDLVRLYESGIPTRVIATDLGVRQDFVARRLKKAGIDLRIRQFANLPPSKKRKQLPIAKVLELFENGVTVQAIAKRFCVNRRAINRVLVENGKTPRGLREAMLIRFQKSTKEYRQQITKAAHAAVTGKRYTAKEKRYRAKSRQRTFSVNKLKGYEREFWELCPFDLIPQFAVGGYNVDFALTEFPIAVEIFGGKWHTVGNHRLTFRQRSEYIRDAGFVSLIIWCFDGVRIRAGCIEYLESLVDVFSRKKAALREQYVILGNGQLTTFGRDKLEYLSGVIRFHNGKHVVSNNNSVSG